MPLRLSDSFYLEAPLKVYVNHKYVKTVVNSDVNLAGTNRVILASVTVPEAGNWKIVGYGRFKHPVANGKYLYTWIDDQISWNSTEWSSFLSNDNLKQTFQAVRIENVNDYVEITVNTLLTVTESKTFNWSFTTDDNSIGTFFDCSTPSTNALIGALQNSGNVENQAYFFAFKISS